MKKIWIGLFMVAALASLAVAGTTTPYYNFYLPAIDETGWGSAVNANFSDIDTELHNLYASYVPNTRSVNGHALSANVSVTKGDVGLGSVLNVDTTNPTNITQSSSYRFVTDTEKNTWNDKSWTSVTSRPTISCAAGYYVNGINLATNSAMCNLDQSGGGGGGIQWFIASGMTTTRTFTFPDADSTVVVASGTPTNHQFAIFTNGYAVKGITVTPSKPVCTNSNGEPVACTNLTDISLSTFLTNTNSGTSCFYSHIGGGSDTCSSSFDIDFSTNHVIPPVITSVTGTCTDKEFAYYSSGTSGQRLYSCETGSWVKQGDGSYYSGSTPSTGSGSLVFATSPTITTPTIGGATIYSQGSGSATSSTMDLSLVSGGTYTTSGNLTLTISNLALGKYFDFKIYSSGGGTLTVSIANWVTGTPASITATKYSWFVCKGTSTTTADCAAIKENF